MTDKNRRQFLTSAFGVGAASAASLLLGVARASASLTAILRSASTTEGFDLGVPGLPRLTNPGLYLLNGPRRCGKTHTLDAIRKTVRHDKSYNGAMYYSQGTYCTGPGSLERLCDRIVESPSGLFHFFDYSRSWTSTAKVHQLAQERNQFAIMTITGGRLNYQDFAEHQQFEQVWQMMSPNKFYVHDHQSFVDFHFPDGALGEQLHRQRIARTLNA